MSLIHVAREGRSLGRFDEQEIADGLLTGRFSPRDLAWKDPMPEWVPLSQLEGLPPPHAPEPSPVAPAPPPLIEPAWERRKETGIPAAATETVSMALGKPRDFFQTMRTEGGYRAPLLFNLLVGTLAGWVALVYQYIIYRANPAGLGEVVSQAGPEFVGSIFLVFAVLLPVGVAVSSFVTSGLFHGCLKLLSSETISFETTFRVYCYAWGSASVFQIVPACGAYLFPALAVYLTVIGLRNAQKVNPWASAFAVVLPVLFCYGAMAVSIAFSGVAVN